jgi:hypothetical protein
LRTSNGSSVGYAAGPSDHCLRRWLPIGTSIEKQKWHLTYQIDGQLIDDFPLRFYIGAFVVAAFLGFIWLARSFETRRAPNRALQPTASRRE